MIKILEPGPLTTIQDAGRVGHLRYAIPPSGPVDRHAFVIANRLVGNDDGAAGLECTLMGPRFEAQAACVIAVTGAAMPVTVNGDDAPSWATVALNAGDVVKLGATRAGVRAYVAFAGGIDVPLVDEEFGPPLERPSLAGTRARNEERVRGGSALDELALLWKRFGCSHARRR